MEYFKTHGVWDHIFFIYHCRSLGQKLLYFCIHLKMGFMLLTRIKKYFCSFIKHLNNEIDDEVMAFVMVILWIAWIDFFYKNSFLFAFSCLCLSFFVTSCLFPSSSLAMTDWWFGPIASIMFGKRRVSILPPGPMIERGGGANVKLVGTQRSVVWHCCWSSSHDSWFF